MPIRLSASTSKLRPISSPSKQLIFWSRSFGLRQFQFFWNPFLAFRLRRACHNQAKLFTKCGTKNGPATQPIFGTHRGHFCGRSETRFNGIGGPKLGSPKTQIETQKWCQFLTPSLDKICLPRDAISKYINHESSVPETWEAHMTRPFFQPKSRPISTPMKPRRSQSHIPNCASCRSKSSAADTQWKIFDMCV